jgi:elongation factor 1-alpha
LGGIDKRVIERFEKEAAEMNKRSFKYAWVLDKLKAERERGITIDIALWKFETVKYYCTVIDAPGHRDFIKNMISGASQADVALLMVPADGNFTAAIARGNHKAGEIQGQTRQHARLINLLGVKQLIVGVNKMDCDTAKYTQARYNEIKDEMQSMLVKVGWKKPFIDKCVPVLPISGWIGDNLLTPSPKMPWWTGASVSVKPKDPPIQVVTLLDALDKMVTLPERDTSKPLRMPVSGIYKIKGVGDVITGRVEQGIVKPKDNVKFPPTDSKSKPCEGSVFSVEMHHKSCPQAGPGDNVGLNIKGLSKDNMPRVGDCMVLKTDTTLKPCKNFTAQVQILDHPGELKKGYCPIAFVRTGRSACKITNINWKIGKDSAGAKMENPPHLKANEMAEVVFEPQGDFVCDKFDNCEGLGRVAIMEGSSVVMLGKAVAVTFKSDDDK